MSRSYDLMMDEVMGRDSSDRAYLRSPLPYVPYELERTRVQIRLLEEEVARLKAKLLDREVV